MGNKLHNDITNTKSQKTLKENSNTISNCRKIYRNNTELMFNPTIVTLLIKNEFPNIPEDDKIDLINCILFLIDDLDVTEWSCFETETSPEKHIFNAVKEYLADGHSLQDFKQSDDDANIFDYLA